MEDTEETFRHRQLVVWQSAMTLAKTVHTLIRSLPPEERYGLYSQISRTSVSVPSNVAEGASRRTKQDFANFLGIARGALAELDTQLELAEAFGYVTYHPHLKEEIVVLARRLNALMRTLTSTSNQPIS